jgi:hypothetical protein
MPFRHERRFVAEFDVALDPVGQLILAGDPDLTQYRPRHFRGEDLTPVQPGCKGRVEDQLAATKLAFEEALGLARAMS